MHDYNRPFDLEIEEKCRIRGLHQALPYTSVYRVSSQCLRYDLLLPILSFWAASPPVLKRVGRAIVIQY